MTSTATTKPVADRTGPRRRGAVLRRAIFDAALEQLRTVGYSRLTMDAVAAAAGTGKAALYRRWPSKDELVTDALRSVLPDPTEVPLTGDARADVLALLRCMRDTIGLSQGTTFQVVKKEGGYDSGLLPTLIQRQVMTPCRDRILQVLRQAGATSRADGATADARVADVGPALLMHHVITEGPVISDAFLDSVVDDVIMPLVGR